MKSKILALILALTVVSWAQTATQTAPSDSTQSSAPADKAKASCCDKMGANGASCPRHGKKDAKDMASCCGGKEMKSCCGGKDAKSCMKDDKSSASCCKDGCGRDKTAASCCSGKECGKGCCSAMKSEKTAKNCCAHDVRG
jgi:hypothetical protein